MKLKNLVILFMVVSFLAFSGCTEPADKLSTLKAKLLAEGYNVIYIEENVAVTTQMVDQKNLVMHVDTRETARYDIVDMAVIAYGYYPEKDMYATKCDAISDESSKGTTLRPSYYVEKGAIVAYINGAVNKEDVKIR